MSCTGYVFILRLYFWQMFTVSCGKENAVVEYGGLIKVHMILYLYGYLGLIFAIED